MNSAKEYLNGRGIDDIKIKDLKLSDILAEYEKTFKNPERKKFKSYPFLYGRVRSFDYKDVTTFIIHKYQILKSSQKVAEFFGNYITKSSILRHVNKVGNKKISVKKGGYRKSRPTYNYKTIKKTMPIVIKKGYSDIDGYIIGERKKGHSIYKISLGIGMNKNWCRQHLKRIGL